MSRRLPVSLTLLLVVAGPLAVACSADERSVEAVVEPGVTAIAQVGGQVCDLDRGMMESAMEAFALLEGELPTSEADLVPDYVREESTLFDILDGTLVAAPTSPC